VLKQQGADNGGSKPPPYAQLGDDRISTTVPTKIRENELRHALSSRRGAFLNPSSRTRKRSAVGDADRCRFAMSLNLPFSNLRRGDSTRGGGSFKSPLFGAPFPPFSARAEKGAAGGSLQGNNYNSRFVFKVKGYAAGASPRPTP
jgi:hypothetical protein